MLYYAIAAMGQIKSEELQQTLKITKFMANSWCHSQSDCIHKTLH